MSDIETSEAFWNSLAENDPLWAILSDPTRRGGRWDLGTFFRSGAREISTLIYQLEHLVGSQRVERNRALDFGCGVGRLTQALAAYYGAVVGIDVSSKMIEHARRLNRYGDRVAYVHNKSEDLARFENGTFDLIYSDLVLQHMPPANALVYIREFLRLLSPRGLLVFQLPSHPRAAPRQNIVAMSNSAYRAQIEVTARPQSWRSEATTSIGLRIKNVSTETWDQSRVGVIRVGNHWLSRDGAMLVQDDARAELPAVLSPGEAATATLDVTVPATGDHLLELDLVHEGYSWFADKGSQSTRLMVGPTDGTRTTMSAPIEVMTWDESFLPRPNREPSNDVRFPMYGIPRNDVLAVIASLGGETFYVENDDRGGQEWAGFRYFIRRSTA
jgi:SAM-dependent methyltransferase